MRNRWAGRGEAWRGVARRADEHGRSIVRSTFSLIPLLGLCMLSQGAYLPHGFWVYQNREKLEILCSSKTSPASGNVGTRKFYRACQLRFPPGKAR